MNVIDDSNLIILLNENASKDFQNKIKQDTGNVDAISVINYPPLGPQASVLLLGVSFVAYKLSEGFISKVGEAIAEETIVKLIKTAKEEQVEPTIITGGNIVKGNTNGFSLHHSIIYELKNKTLVKFIFKSDWSQAEATKATILFNRERRKLKESEPNQITNIIETKIPYNNMYLLTADLDTNTLIPVDIFNK